MTRAQTRVTTSHWGAFEITAEDGRITKTAPFAHDPMPPAIADIIPAAVHHTARITQPHIRKGWRDKDAGTQRGADTYIPVPWDDALDLAAA